MEDEEAKKEMLENAAKKVKLDAAECGSAEDADALDIKEESNSINETPTKTINESMEIPDDLENDAWKDLQ